MENPSIPLGDPEHGHILVAGHSIANSITPHFHRTVFRSLGIDWPILLLDTADPAELQAAMAKPGFVGAAVSLPLKDAVAPFLDRLEKDAKILQSVNTVFVRQVEDLNRDDKMIELVGANSDWRGMQSCIVEAAASDSRREVHQKVEEADGSNSLTAGVVIGTGVLSSTAVYALVIGLGLRYIYLVGCPQPHLDSINAMLATAGYANKTTVTCLNSFKQAQDCVSLPCFIIHAARASPRGEDLDGQRVQRIVEHFVRQKSQDHSPCVLLDMAYNAKDDTDFTSTARTAGWHIASFLDFMAHQAIRQNAYWTGASSESLPSVEACRNILEEGLAQKR